ncbi:TKL/LISK/LISK-DD1 protein kinase [Hysterangium stoloniferum]|nr:TKL/LISK/LISK-DD1 protein kinase [Hysterangium stoloniferum]
MAETSFDVIPFDDIKGSWKKLGSGSFGNVYKGTYLGIDVAIKEVLPSTEYDVAKYFEREWRLMKEARHPNVVLYLGLSRAPDGRVFIVSEFIENGNIRLYIHDKTKPFGWRLRLSFATDVCRALAYLHARKCIHRDLKGENLLLTANLRVKITDFGFARIAARNEAEARRLTFCGTDAYMSPEILIGNAFDLPTDIFSLGIIFAEISARHLADDHHFARSAPSFGIDPAEVRRRASPGCPEAFIDLILDCLKEDPQARPPVTEVLARLRIIELEVVSWPSEEANSHVGSVKFLSRGRRPGAAPRIPSFGLGGAKSVRKEKSETLHEQSDGESSDDDHEIMEAVMALGSVELGEHAWNDEFQRLIPSETQSIPTIGTISTVSDYSTTVIKAAPNTSSRSSILTVRPGPPANISPTASTLGATGHASLITIDSFHTANGSLISIAGATEGGSTIRAPSIATSTTHARTTTPPLLHRFTLIKPGAKRAGLSSPSRNASPGPNSRSTGSSSWSPFHFFFTSGLLSARCDICGQRLGWKSVLECDDCGIRTHLKCGDHAPRDCGIRPVVIR